MKTLIAPGMWLIARLSFANKFILISLLFFVPLVWLSYSVIHGAWQQIEITKSQRKGLELLQQSQSTLQVAERFRDSRLIAAYQMDASYQAKADEYYQTFEKSLLDLAAIEAEFTDDEAYTKPLNELQAAAKKARSVAVSNEASMEATFSVINAVVIQIRNLEKAILQLSGLSQDSNPETKSMIDFSVRDLHPYSEVLGKIRGIGSYSLTQNYLNSATANELDDISGKLYDIQPLLLKSAKLMIPASYQDLHTETESFSKALTGILQSVDKNIVGAMDLSKPWQEFFDESTRVIDQKFAISHHLLERVDTRLGNRQAEESGKLNIISIAIGLVMVLIIYLYSAFYLSLRLSIVKLVEATDRMAEGDMRINMAVSTEDELGHLTERFNQTAARIRDLISAVQTTSIDVKEQTNDVSRITQITSDAIHQQMQETEQAASAITEMSSNFNEVADFSSQAENAAQSASEESNTGRKKVQQTLSDINRLADEINSTAEVIDQLAKDSANISQVLVQIKGIAEQTNLLALNAAIEAARAGEHGRGFAVVADEVRSLSQRTHQSTEEIEEMIAKILSGVDNAVNAMAESHKMAGNTVSESKQVELSLEAINDKISTIVEMNSHIAEAVKQQAMTAEDIDRNIIGISRVAEDNVKNAQETTEASQAMSNKVNELAHMLSSFKIS